MLMLPGESLVLPLPFVYSALLLAAHPSNVAICRSGVFLVFFIEYFIFQG